MSIIIKKTENGCYYDSARPIDLFTGKALSIDDIGNSNKVIVELLHIEEDADEAKVVQLIGLIRIQSDAVRSQAHNFAQNVSVSALFEEREVIDCKEKLREAVQSHVDHVFELRQKWLVDTSAMESIIEDLKSILFELIFKINNSKKKIAKKKH